MTSLVFRLLTSYQLFCPIVPKFFYFRGDYIEQFDNHDYSWHGKLMAIDSHFICEDSFTYGIITVLQRDSAVFGEIVIDTIGYQIRDLTGGLSALIALDITEFDLDCGMVSDTAGIQQPGDLDSRGSYAGQAVCPVRVGVLYTEGIGPVLPDYDRIAELGIFNTNQILRNSQLLEYSLRFVLAGVELLPSNRWEQSANLNFDRTDIATNSFVLSQRQIMNADIMIVLTRVYPNGFGAVADFGDEPADVDNAFALVAFKYMGNPRYSFSHEIFHLFGARHDGSNACWVPDVFEPPPVPYAYGYNWYTGSNFFGTRRYYKTIMAICPPHCANGCSICPIQM